MSAAIAIANDTSTTSWGTSFPTGMGVVDSEKYCWYNNDPATYKNPYGALYNWHSVNPSSPNKIALAGWHMSTKSEWNVLQNFFIANGYNWDSSTTGNKIAKSMSAKTGWNLSNTIGSVGNDPARNNTTGFSGVPGGYVMTMEIFYMLGQIAIFGKRPNMIISAHIIGFYFLTTRICILAARLKNMGFQLG